MTQKEILDGNLLIARVTTINSEALEHDLKKAGTIESMQYHNDWNWLMPAVQILGSKVWDIDEDMFYDLNDAIMHNEPYQIYKIAIDVAKKIQEHEQRN